MSSETQIVLGESQGEHETRLAATDAVRQALEMAWKLAATLPAEQREAAQNLLKTGWDAVIHQNEAISMMIDRLTQAGALVESLTASAMLMQQQRDQIAEELGNLANAIERQDLTHPVILKFYQEMYEDVMEEHNGNFWESLPYDMAAVLGKDWQHYDANKLYELLTTDFDNEWNPEDFGWTQSQVNKFRADLRQLVREMSDGDD